VACLAERNYLIAIDTNVLIYACRGLIDAIVLTPDQGELQIELKGNLAAMLSAAENAKRSPETGDLSLQVQMVAGARNQRYLQLWRSVA
jgi:hypothetical protein